MRRSKRGSEEVRLGTARKQREVIRDVMLSAGQCATWLTLDELAKLTHYPPASISAQLRHLRKPRFGGYAVVKRCRAVNKAMRAEGFGALWEYAVEAVQRVLGRRTKGGRRRGSRRRRGGVTGRAEPTRTRTAPPPVAVPGASARRTRGARSARRPAWA